MNDSPSTAFQPLPDATIYSLSPTDVTQFVRLEQCERFLRLRLHQRHFGLDFMKDFGAVPQTVTPLLRLSGSEFEDDLENLIEEASRSENNANVHETMRCASEEKSSRNRSPDNKKVCDAALALLPNALLTIFQPRLEVEVGSWQLRGDLDVLRLRRDADDKLHVLIADMKSSAGVKVEHRLQVAFYHEMVRTLFLNEGIDCSIELGILYRGADDTSEMDAAEIELRAQHTQAARDEFGIADTLFAPIPDKASYIGSVHDLVTNPDSTSSRVAQAQFEKVPFHLTRKCDHCTYQEFCLKWSAQHDNLSLIPLISLQEKGALERNGIDTISKLAHLKRFRDEESTASEVATTSEEPSASEVAATTEVATTSAPTLFSDLVSSPGQEALVRSVAATWPVGARVDELVHRARRYRKWKGDDLRFVKNIPSKGYGSLPFCDAEHDPNLVRVYIDAQHDYLHDRIYLLGALVVASENGEIARRRHIVHLAEQPSGEVGASSGPHMSTHAAEQSASQGESAAQREEKLFLDWSKELLDAVYELAAPDANGEKRAPIHLIFWDSAEQTMLLEGLGRHASAVLSATPLYDFVTQIAAFDSPLVSFLQQEIREMKNYPLVAQSLQAVSEHLFFGWDQSQPFRTLFHERHFDSWGKLGDNEIPLGDNIPWFTRCARFNSSIPLEYAYAAWNALPHLDDFAPFRAVDFNTLKAFQARRLDAMEHIASDFQGNKIAFKTPFSLPDLANFQGKAHDLAHALDEFVTIERHVALAEWKKARLAPPERRVVAGDTLLVRYLEEDQQPEIVERNRDNEIRRIKHEAWKEANSETKKRPKNVMDETRWEMSGMRFRLRLECAGIDCDLSHALAVSTLRVKDRVVISSRVTQDSRLPPEERRDFTPTPKQLLYGMRADIIAITPQPDSKGRAQRAWIEVEIAPNMSAGKSRGWVFSGFHEPLFPNASYTLDGDPNDWQGNHCSQITQQLCSGASNTLLQRLNDLTSAQTHWPQEAQEAQAKFLNGLDALREIGKMHDFEKGKRDFIGSFGDAPVLLVQGPPGTGKSYSTAFALFARMQGAMAAGLDWRVFVSCKTHAATDVLLENIIKVQKKLRGFAHEYSTLFSEYFDARLLDAPIFRLGKTETLDGATPLPKDREREAEQLQAFKTVSNQSWCFVGATPGGTRGMLKDAKKDLLSTYVAHCLVLDEASQMNLPEAIMAALPLHENGQLIVVGDHRQMPPIIKHDWQFEPRRTFAEFKSYASLFEALLELKPPKINFEESFRLHADMAEFLRREIYQQDGIAYHSNQTATLEACEHEDPFVCAALSPQHPLVVIVHRENKSLRANPYEGALMTPLLEALAHADLHALDAATGLGIVVPHRAQKAAMQNALWNVDTVERFQGDERTAIVVGATESDRDYLLISGKFLLDPRRLTVALSRAKQKMILVAAESVFNVFSPDEETFANAQLWKNLLRHTCTVPLWHGERHGEPVSVWGNAKQGLSRAT